MVCKIEGIRIGLLVCEDVWVPEIVEATCALGADLIIVVNASPFAENKIFERYWHLTDRASNNQIPIAYVNLVGGQDELVFDGGSFAVNRQGKSSHKLIFLLRKCSILSGMGKTWLIAVQPLYRPRIGCYTRRSLRVS